MERKLQISELSVGDWVMFDGEPAKAMRLTMAGRLIFGGLSGQIYGSLGGDIFPLPITPEILEKNGFERSKEYSGKERTPYIFRRGKKKGPFGKVTVNLFHPTDKRLFRRGVYHELVYESPMFAGHWNFAYVKYVHELQHALRLAGIDKEIEL